MKNKVEVRIVKEAFLQGEFVKTVINLTLNQFIYYKIIQTQRVVFNTDTDSALV